MKNTSKSILWPDNVTSDTNCHSQNVTLNMEKNEAYHKYQRFLTEVERRFAEASVGKSEEEKNTMLQLTQRIIDSFVDLYGDGGADSTLLIEARMVLLQNKLALN